jgi:hypothetical protein
MFEQAVEHQSKALAAVGTNREYSNSLRDHYYFLASAAYRQEDHAAVAQAAAGLLQSRPDVADDALRASRYLGFCILLVEQDAALADADRQALKQSYGDTSMEYMREALRRGLTDVKKVKAGESAVPMRARRDFRELVQNMYRVENALEGEKLRVRHVSAGTTTTQSMIMFSADQWSGDKQLYWLDAGPGDRLDLEFEVSDAGSYNLEMVLTKAPDYGVVQLLVDESKLGEPLDLYVARTVKTTDVLNYNGLPLAAGPHVLSIEIVGANPAAIQAFMFGLDYIRLRPSAGGP